MIVMPLGVGSATPTADRHLASVALWREGRVFLFDCGENAQMRLLQAGMKRSKIDYVLITHLDGDHFFGLPGLISTMQLQRREKPLHIIAPKGIKEFVDSFLKVSGIELFFEVIYTEIEHDTEHQVVVDEPDFFIECRNLKHNKFCVGFRFQEKDKPGKVNSELATELGISEDEQFKALKAGEDVKLKDGSVVKASEVVGTPVKGNIFAYVTDTEFCENCIRLAENATILYHEATFGQALKDKASETGHCTAQEAAIVAKTANAERLVIGHFSARYTNPFVLLKEAKQVFDETWIATELRPIMTDPAQEKNIFKPAVKETEQRSFDNRRPQQRRGGPPNRSSGGGRDGFRPRSNNFRPRYNNDRGGSNRGGYVPRERAGGSNWNDRERRDYTPRDRDYSNRDYNSRDRDYNNRDRDYNNRDRDYNRDRNNPQGGDRPERQDRGFSGPPNRDFNRDRDYNRDRRDFPPRDRDNTRPRTDRGDRPDNRPPNRDADNNRGRSTGTNIPITPRTPFDEFDRF